MTYLGFLALFVWTPLVLIIAVAVARIRVDGARSPQWIIGPRVVVLLAVISVLWTTPWDNWIIGRGVWSYHGDRLIGTVFRVPVEEYLFMVSQTLLVGLWTLCVFSLNAAKPHLIARPVPESPQTGHRRIRSALVWLGVALAGSSLAAHYDHWVYLGSLLLWFGPVFALQRAVCADELRQWRIPRALSLLPVALLWIADFIGIKEGIWSFSNTYTLGLRLNELPVEDALFFLVTSLLLVDGLLLSLHPAVGDKLSAAAKVLVRHRSGRKLP